MNRVERKKIEREERKNSLKRLLNTILSMIFIVSTLFLGLITVDKNNRNMMLREESRLFQYKKVDFKKYEIVFCGDKYELDTEKITVYFEKIGNKVIIGFKTIKEFVEEKRDKVVRIIGEMEKDKNVK